MTVSARKITAFAKLVAGLADTPNLGSTTLLKQWFDSSPEELRVAINGLIDDLIATAAGASGTEQIGSAPISGVAGATAYAQLVDLKNQLTSAVMGSLTDETKSALTQKIGLINGGFDVWQRGTSFALNNLYSADRWFTSISATSGAGTVSRQPFTIGQSAVPNNPKYYLRINPTALTGCTYFVEEQRIEGVDKFAGQTVTVSFWAKADTAQTISAFLRQNFGTGGAPSAEVLVTGSNIVLTTTWTKYTVTFILPSISGKTLGSNANDFVAFGINLPVTGVYSIDIAQTQLNTGSIALPVQPRSFAEELQLCQRYYEKSYDIGTAPGTSTTSGAKWFESNGILNMGIPSLNYIVRKRLSPTVTLYSTTGASGKVRNTVAFVDYTVVLDSGGETGFQHWINGASGAAGDDIRYQYVADSEL